MPAAARLSILSLAAPSFAQTERGYIEGVGGLRWQPRAPRRVVPFILGGLGVAHLTPSARFTFTDGTLPTTDPSATPPNTGDDVTTQISTLGVFTLGFFLGFR